MSTALRNDRQAAQFPSEQFQNLTITVIGTGAIGRQVGLQLAAIGVPSVTLFDHDRVETQNLGNQGWSTGDVGRFKVKVMERDMRAKCQDMVITTHARRFNPAEDQLGNVVFICVDSIVTRSDIWESAKLPERSLYVDGRMHAETFQIVTVADGSEEDCAYYRRTLFTADEAFHGSCTSRSTIFTSNIVSGFMVGQMSLWLRGLPLKRDFVCNTMTQDIFVP